MNPRTRLILAVLGALVVCVAFFFFFIRPRQQELGEVRDSISAEQARTTQLESELARLEDLQANAPELEAELAQIRGFVPRDDEVPSFIFLVQDAANAAGVDFVQITPQLPKPPPEGAALAEIRTQIRAGGGYFAIQDFIRRLHNLDRAVRVDGITLTGEEEETGDLNVTLDSTARIFFEAPAVPPAVDPATGLPVDPAPVETTVTPAG